MLASRFKVFRLMIVDRTCMDINKTRVIGRLQIKRSNFARIIFKIFFFMITL